MEEEKRGRKASGFVWCAGGKRRSSCRCLRLRWHLLLSPPRILLLVAVLVFTAEAVTMLLINSLFPPLPPLGQALLDAGILLLFLSPIYFFVYLPLKVHYAEHLQDDREIRHLSRATLLALERERCRFVKDLHDGCGQLLAALQLGLDIQRLTLPPERTDLVDQCRQLQDFVGQLGDHVRTLSARLRPPLLETLGIVPALEWYIQQLREKEGGGIFDLKVEGCPKRLPPELEITLFRLCEEGIGNILRHARARRGEVRLACAPEGIGLDIIDDGIGFDPSVAAGNPPSCLGLIGMRERVAALGGTLVIDAAPGRGTALRIFFPHTETE